MTSLTRTSLVASSLLLGAFCLLAPNPVRGQDAAPAGYDLAGNLTGTVLYTDGHRASVDVVLEATPNLAVFAGTYTLRLETEDAPETRTGTVEVRLKGDHVEARFDKLSASVTLAPASSHATFSLYGTFSKPGGVFMLYRYAR